MLAVFASYSFAALPEKMPLGRFVSRCSLRSRSSPKAIVTHAHAVCPAFHGSGWPARRAASFCCSLMARSASALACLGSVSLISRTAALIALLMSRCSMCLA